MYSGVSKDDGGIVGVVGKDFIDIDIDIENAAESTSADETLIGLDASSGQSNAFRAVLSAETGGDILWIPDNDLDAYYRRTVSMSQMTSMLRDRDRNTVYEKSIQKLIQYFWDKEKRAPRVLDIGTGTGLLASFCAKYGAQQVVGCEMFSYMASIAENIVKDNNLNESIQVIACKSTDLDQDQIAFDLTVSELLDSLLLGESVLLSHTDAIERLMSPLPSEGMSFISSLEDRILPHSAAIYVVAVESTQIAHMHDLSFVSNTTSYSWTPYRNDHASDCDGGRVPIPIHWNEFKEATNARTLSLPVKALEISLHTSYSEDSRHVSKVKMSIAEDGIVHGIMMYWNLMLLSPNIDPDRTLSYSTAPNVQNWQDHWLQVVHPLPRSLFCKAGDNIEVTISYNSIKIWISAEKLVDDPVTLNPETKKQRLAEDLIDVADNDEDSSYAPNQCSCGWHILYGAERFQGLSDSYIQNRWSIALDWLITILYNPSIVCSGASDSCIYVVQDLADGTTLSLTLVKKIQCHPKLNFLRIVSRESKQFSNLFFSQLSQANNFESRLMIWDGKDSSDILEYFTLEAEEEEEEEEEESVEVGEQENGNEKHHSFDSIYHVATISDCFYFQLHTLPVWQAVNYYHQRRFVCQQSILAARLTQPISIPSKAQIMIAAFELVDLRGAHGPVIEVNDMNHAAYDRVIKDDWFNHLYPYKLGNYRKKILTKPTCLISLDYNNLVDNLESLQNRIEIPIVEYGRCDTVVIWVDYCLVEQGLAKDLTDETIEIEYYRDGNFPLYYTTNLKFLRSPVHVIANSNQLLALAEYDVNESNFQFHFEIR